jgi:hypothetical protein
MFELPATVAAACPLVPASVRQPGMRWGAAPAGIPICRGDDAHRQFKLSGCKALKFRALQ